MKLSLCANTFDTRSSVLFNALYCLNAVVHLQTVLFHWRTYHIWISWTWQLSLGMAARSYIFTMTYFLCHFKYSLINESVMMILASQYNIVYISSETMCSISVSQWTNIDKLKKDTIRIALFHRLIVNLSIFSRDEGKEYCSQDLQAFVRFFCSCKKWEWNHRQNVTDCILKRVFDFS